MNIHIVLIGAVLHQIFSVSQWLRVSMVDFDFSSSASFAPSAVNLGMLLLAWLLR